MPREVADEVLAFLRASGVKTLDITGGAPELNPHFRYLVSAARALGVHVMDRCNLTILEQPGQEDLAEFLAATAGRDRSLRCPATSRTTSTASAARACSRQHRGAAQAERARLRQSRHRARAQPGLQPAGPVAAAGAGEARGRLTRASAARRTASCSTGCSRSPTCRSSASASMLISKGQFEQLHDAAARRATARRIWTGDVPHAAVGGLAGLRVRLRLQPDARAARSRWARKPRTQLADLIGQDLAGNADRRSPITATAAPPGRARAAAAPSPERAARAR